jgi:hypothetical protein
MIGRIFMMRHDDGEALDRPKVLGLAALARG